MTNFVSYRDGGKTNEEGLYKFLLRAFGTGVPTGYNANSLSVTQRAAGANMSADIAVGDAHIPYSTYSVWGFTDAVNNVTVSAADATNPRRDIVVAYIDLSVVSSASNNNPNALKFKTVSGTAAASPSDPLDATIQSSVGSGNPWIKLARLTIPNGVSTVVNAYITDLRTPMTFNLPAGNVTSTMIADGTIATGDIADGAVTPAKMTGIDLFGVTSTSMSGGTVPPAGTGLFLIQAGNVTVSTNSNGDATITLPTAFPNGIIAIVPGNTGSIADDATVSITPASLSAFNVSSPQKSASVNVSYIAIGW